MNLDQDLREALKAVAGGYRPTDQLAAREELLRRTRRRKWIQAGATVAFAAGMAALAFLVVPQQMSSEEVARPPQEQIVALPPFGERAQEINVGEGALGVAFDGDDGTLFALNAEDGSLMSISAADNQVHDTIAIGGAPSNLAYSDEEGLWAVDPGTGQLVGVSGGDDAPLEVSGRYALAEPGDHMDVDVGHGFVWVASRDNPFVRHDPTTGEQREYSRLASDPTDVAVGARSVWIYDSDNGNIGDIDPQTGDVLSYSFVPHTKSRNGDIFVGPGGVWVANGDVGKLFQFTYDGELRAKIDVGGDFAGIWIGDGSVWVVSGSQGQGRLLRIDPTTASLIDEPVEFVGRSFDLVTGAGSVWVSDYSDGTITEYPIFPASIVPADDTDPSNQTDTDTAPTP